MVQSVDRFRSTLPWAMGWHIAIVRATAVCETLKKIIAKTSSFWQLGLRRFSHGFPWFPMVSHGFQPGMMRCLVCIHGYRYSRWGMRIGTIITQALPGLELHGVVVGCGPGRSSLIKVCPYLPVARWRTCWEREAKLTHIVSPFASPRPPTCRVTSQWPCMVILVVVCAKRC